MYLKIFCLGDVYVAKKFNRLSLGRCTSIQGILPSFCLDDVLPFKEPYRLFDLDDVHPFKEFYRLFDLDDVHPFKEFYRRDNVHPFKESYCLFDRDDVHPLKEFYRLSSLDNHFGRLRRK